MVGNAESDNKNTISDKKIELITMELTNLRAELRELKTCQIQFVTFAFTTSGIILGLQNSISPLIPLIIILPTWWIFFDKAKTVSRIIGYYRILEKAYLGDVKFNFIGWENAQSIYRKKKEENIQKKESEKTFETEKNKISFRKKIKDLLSLKASSYWTLVYLTFLGLGIVCLGLYFFLKINSPGDTLKWVLSSSLWEIFMSLLKIEILASLVIIIIFLYSGYKNIQILFQLIWEEHSYDENERFWNEILSVQEIKSKNPLYDNSFLLG